MVAISFVEPDGTRKEAVAAESVSVMSVARANGIGGILAECGGNMACGTCHVYVQQSYFSRIPEPEEMEDQMLDATASARQPNSRLSCQIIITAALDGVEITCPESQI
jgi:2Fe-2S ferredoxin